MRNLLIAFSLILLNGCIEDDGSIIYTVMSDDDKSYLYNCATNVGLVDKIYNFSDTIYFLRNSRDTIIVPVVTRISPYKTIIHNNRRSIFGESFLKFDSLSGFKYALITIDHFYKDPNSLKWFEVALEKENSQSFVYVVQPEDTVQYLDSAFVLGRLYQHVYKFDGKSINTNSQIKLIYFALDWGYLYIEGIDGRKVELITKKSKMKDANI